MRQRFDWSRLAVSTLLRRRFLPGWTDAAFGKLLRVNPAAIRHYQDIRELRHPRIRSYRPDYGVDAKRFVTSNLGKVLGGDWDLQRFPFEQNDIYRLLSEHFQRGVPWEETEVFREFLAAVKNGEKRWHWSASYEELLDAAAAVERLYRDISANGYRSRDRQGCNLYADEITVSIGRGGKMLYNNVGGHHRLSIAKLLGLEEIPVRVLVRHREWQDLRDDLRRNRSLRLASSRAGGEPAHPDLQDLVHQLR